MGHSSTFMCRHLAVRQSKRASERWRKGERICVCLYLSLINIQITTTTTNGRIERRNKKKTSAAVTATTTLLIVIENADWIIINGDEQERRMQIVMATHEMKNVSIQIKSYTVCYFYYLPYELKTCEASARIQNDWSQVYVWLELKFSTYISNKMKLISIEWNVHKKMKLKKMIA